MRKKLVVGVALVAVAVVAAPAAQAGVPEIKRFPKVFVNGVKATSTPKQAVAFGHITLENTTIGNLNCNNVVTGNTFNSTENLSEKFTTEKGFTDSTGYMTFECVSEAACKVKNTKGEEVEGIYATAEAPPVIKGTEIHNAGISSLPWTGELIERETEKTQVLTHKVKVWIVLPPATVGVGPGCAGTELEFEDQEGPTEKEHGYELAPYTVNGTKNGLKPSHGEFHGREGLTEKEAPNTGRLKSPQVGDGFTTAPKLISGGLGGGWELETSQ
jgi:hypothetical protein